jgi:hypothetical protein
MAYELGGLLKPKSPAEVKCEQLTFQLSESTTENAALKLKITEMQAIIDSLQMTSPRRKLDQAIVTDAVVNESGLSYSLSEPVL